MTRHFSPKLFTFLKDLKDNNDRVWFKANQARYEEEVREPALAFIEDFGEHLLKISPHFTADPRKVGGSLFRIQRDTRFGTDKTPYKTGVGIQFRHVATQGDVHAPGFYLHIEPGECFCGLGLWRPSTADALKIRQAIDDEQAAWKKAAYAQRFTDRFALEGDSLKRPPKGFDPDHRYIDDLKRKDFIASRRLTQKSVTSDGFINEYANLCKAGSPFMEFLAKAVEVGF